MNILNSILIGGRFSTQVKDTIETWNEKLNGLAANYTDSPWAGMAIFIILLVISFVFISSSSKK